VSTFHKEIPITVVLTGTYVGNGPGTVPSVV
jgi:hypothetical protein